MVSYRQGMRIHFFESKYNYETSIQILPPNIGGACILPKVWVLQTFQYITSTISLNHSRDHDHLHLHQNKQYYAHLPTHPTNCCSIRGALSHHNFFPIYHRLPNLKIVLPRQFSRHVIRNIGFNPSISEDKHYVRYVMHPQCYKTMYLNRCVL